MAPDEEDQRESCGGGRRSVSENGPNMLVAIEDWPFPILGRVVTSPVFGADKFRTDRGDHPSLQDALSSSI